MENDRAEPLATGSGQSSGAEDGPGAWDRWLRGFGRIDERFRRQLPSGENETLDLKAAWQEAGVLRLLVVFQVLIFWARGVLPPLSAKDYDVFFHLAQGRYQDVMGKLPTEAWFSFLESRPYFDYYWLFQRLVFELWQNFGPAGLFVLRALIFSLLLGLLLAFFYGRRVAGSGVWAGLLVFTLVGSRFVEVMGVVRPFVFSYLFLLTMLFILELRPRWMPLLPFVGILWVNLHGVEHPLMLAVVLAYLGDEFLAWCRRRSWGPEDRRRMTWLVLTLPTVLLSPQGFDLVTFPFRSTALASLYIGEMQKPTLEELFTWSLGPETQTGRYVVPMFLFLLAVVAIGERWRRQNLRPAHLVLAIAGSWLALQGFRFTAEFALLLLPLLSQGFLTRRRGAAAWAQLPAAAIVGLLTFGVAQGWVADSRGAYPVAFNAFPHLTATFLAKEAESGARVYNSPDVGAFYMWEWGDRHQIMMNLEVAAIFLDQDILLNRMAMLDGNVFRGFVEQYRPDYLAVSHEMALASPFLRASEDFVPVAFDDSVLLLVDRHRQPEVAAKWRLRALDPFQVKLDSDYRLSPEAAVEARRLYALERRGFRLPTLLAQEAIGRGDVQSAQVYVDTVLEIAPESADGWTLAGYLALQRNDPAGAVSAFEKSLRRTPKANRPRQHTLLARALYRLGERREALRHFEARGPFFDLIPIQDLAMQVELFEEFGSSEEAVAARRLLELRRGEKIYP